MYNLCSAKVKYYFGSVMSGETVIPKNAYKQAKNYFLGIPMTTDILIEIVCFGLGSDDKVVSLNKSDYRNVYCIFVVYRLKFKPRVSFCC